MSVILQAVDFQTIAPLMSCLYKKIKDRSPLLPTTNLVGLYRNGELQGYFALNPYEDGTLEIFQGYLKPEANHKGLSKLGMKLLQKTAKELGYKRIVLKAERSFKAYGLFMKVLGFKPETVIYSKQI